MHTKKTSSYSPGHCHISLFYLLFHSILTLSEVILFVYLIIICVPPIRYITSLFTGIARALKPRVHQMVISALEKIKAGKRDREWRDKKEMLFWFQAEWWSRSPHWGGDSWTPSKEVRSRSCDCVGLRALRVWKGVKAKSRGCSWGLRNSKEAKLPGTKWAKGRVTDEARAMRWMVGSRLHGAYRSPWWPQAALRMSGNKAELS